MADKVAERAAPGWWEMDGPVRELVFAYLQDRLRSLQVREQLATKDQPMLAGWVREQRVLAAVKELYDWLERKELERVAAEDKKGKRS